jgi:protoheme IX farnesyltransferase
MLLKRRTPQNIVIGGAAGAFPPLIGYAAVAGTLDLAAWIIFAIIFLWTPPHFWALALYKDTDYDAANIPMMPVVRGKTTTKRQMLFYMVLLLGATMLLTVVGAMGALYGAVALALGVVFTYCVVRTLLDDTNRWARRTFAASIVYLGLLFGAMSADSIWTEPLWPTAESSVAVRQATREGADQASDVRARATRVLTSSREIASVAH